MAITLCTECRRELDTDTTDSTNWFGEEVFCDTCAVQHYIETSTASFFKRAATECPNQGRDGDDVCDCPKCQTIRREISTTLDDVRAGVAA